LKTTNAELETVFQFSFALHAALLASEERLERNTVLKEDLLEISSLPGAVDSVLLPKTPDNSFLRELSQEVV